jgi:hypothetical protein
MKINKVEMYPYANEMVASIVSEDSDILERSAEAMKSVIEVSAMPHNKTGEYIDSFEIKENVFKSKNGYPIRDYVITSDAKYVYNLEFGHSTLRRRDTMGKKVLERQRHTKPARIIANAVTAVGGTLGDAYPFAEKGGS